MNKLDKRVWIPIIGVIWMALEEDKITLRQIALNIYHAIIIGGLVSFYLIQTNQM